MTSHSVFQRGVMSAGLLLTLIGPAVQAQAATYHVNNQAACSDAGPGTQEQPWCTFKRGLQGLASGETLYVHEGVYRVTDQKLTTTPALNGTEGNPTVIRNYAEDTPQIFLSEALTGGWTLHSGAIWKWDMDRPGNRLPEQVVVTSASDPDAAPLARLKQVNSFETSACGEWTLDYLVPPQIYLPTQQKANRTGPKLNENDMEPGDFYYKLSTGELFVWLPDSANPNTYTIEVALSAGVDFSQRQWIELRGLDFRYGNTASDAWVFQDGAWQNGTMDCQRGMLRVAGARNILLEDVAVQYSDTNGMANNGCGAVGAPCVFENSVFSHNGHAGVSGNSGRDNLFEDNTFEGNNWRGFNSHHGAAAIKEGFGMQRFTFRHNLVTGTLNGAPGVWLDVAGPDNLIEGNMVHDNASFGIFVEISCGACEPSTEPPIVVRNNIVVNNALAQTGLGIYVAGSSNVHVLHNTLYGNKIALAEQQWALQNGTTLKHNTVFNNIVMNAPGWSLGIPPNGATGVINDSTVVVADDNAVDDNLFYHATESSLFRLLTIGGWGGQGTDYTFDDWQSQTPFDAHSSVADPQFVSDTTEPYDFHLMVGSPAIDAGADVGVMTDVEGDARPQGAGYDIGADEVVLPANQPPVLAPIGNRSVNEGQLLTFTASATDPDGDALTYTASPLPSGATFSGQTFSWTPGFTQAGSYPVTFSVSDGTLTDTELVTITVVPVNRPPVLNAIGNQTVNEGQLLSVTVSASDPDGDALTYTASPLPSGATFTGQTFSWTPGFTQAGTYPVTFTVSDGSLGDEELVLITVSKVDATPPSIPAGLIATALSDSEIALAWQASTDDAGVTGYEVFRDGAWLTTTLSPAYTDPGLAFSTTYTYTVVAFDAAGNRSAPSQPATATTLPLPDLGAPRITAVSPAAGATGVGLGVVLQVSVSEPLDPATVTPATLRLALSVGGTTVPIAVGYVPGSTEVTVTPTGDLKPGLPYTLTVTTGVQDATGTPLAEPYTTTFTTGFVTWHAGAYTLTSMDQQLSGTETFFTNVNSGYVDGVALRMTWQQMEPTAEGRYDWSRLENNLNLIKQKGKKASLVIFPRTSKVSLPPWLTGNQRYYSIDENPNHPTYGQCLQWPIPWDPVFREKYLNFISALGAHLDSNPSLKEVISYMNGSGDAVTINWAYGGMLKNVYRDSDCTNATTWSALGFTANTLIAELKLHIDAFLKVFPDTPQWFSVGDTAFDVPLSCGDATCIAAEAAHYGFANAPDRFGVWREDLNADRPSKTPPREGSLWEVIAAYRPKIGAQMVWNVQDCGTSTSVCRMLKSAPATAQADVLRQAIQIGSSNDPATGDGYYLMPYQEIYQVDVADTALTSAFIAAKETYRWQSDTTPPSTPPQPTASDLTATSVTLSWTASTDRWDKTNEYTDSLTPASVFNATNLGSIGYRLFRNGALVATTNTPSYTDTPLTAGTTYAYTVTAFDAADNASAPSAPVLVTTPSATGDLDGDGRVTPADLRLLIQMVTGQATPTPEAKALAVATDQLTLADVRELLRLLVS